MRTFSNLVTASGNTSAHLPKLFAELAAEAGIDLYDGVSGPPLSGMWVLALVAPYSRYDMELVDEYVQRRSDLDLGATFYDVLRCRDDQEIRMLLPGIERPIQPPFVAVWRDGELIRTAQGFEGRTMLRQMMSDSNRCTTEPSRKPE